MTGSEEKNLRIIAYGKQQVEVSLLIGKEPGNKKKARKKNNRKAGTITKKKKELEIDSSTKKGDQHFFVSPLPSCI